MKFSDLTSAEKLLLSFVGASALLLTGFIVICLVRKECWLNKYIWREGKKKRMSDDIICIRYPPDIYPSSVGVYRENIIKTPEDEMARLFASYGQNCAKRDSTYSSMSESSTYDTPPNNLTGSGSSSATSPMSPGHQAADQAQNKQPFFTFALKYDNDHGLVNIDFLEARNLPFREYLNQPCDAFFALEILPKKTTRGKAAEMMRYRFVTKTIEKAVGTCDFSENFLAQLSKTNLIDYTIRFTAFDQDKFGNPTELGQTSLTFDDFRDFTQHKLILSCSLKEPVMKTGDILLGLSYLPTSERLSVTIVKVTGLGSGLFGTIQKHQNICYVRLLLMRADTGKIIKKKKTTFQRLANSGTAGGETLFNETMTFDMPSNELIQTVLLVLVSLTDKIPSNSTTNTNPTTNGSNLSPTNTNSTTTSYKSNIGGGLLSTLASALPNASTSSISCSPPAGGYFIEDRRGSSVSSSRRSSDQQEEALFHYASESGFVKSTNSGPPLTNENGELETMTASEALEQQQSQTNQQRRHSRSRDCVVGKVAFGYSVKNLIGKYHWEKMIRTPRNVINEWHSLK